MRYTVVGCNGFLGSALVNFLRALQHDVICIDRNYEDHKKHNLGNVIFAAGVTTDFRDRVFETANSHISVVNKMLHEAEFESFLYLSSTRFYKNANSTEEESSIQLCSHDPDQLYDITKIAGEAICFSYNDSRVRVARLSNIVSANFASNNFLDQIVKQALAHNCIELQSPLNATKDYLLLSDAVWLLQRISENGASRCYNVASGVNISNKTLLHTIQEITAAKVITKGKNISVSDLCINIERVKKEFGFRPKNVLTELKRGINERLN